MKNIKTNVNLTKEEQIEVFGSYWDDTFLVGIRAIKFTDPDFLAGPFNKFYGLVKISHNPKTPSLEDKIGYLKNSINYERSMVYWPPNCYERVKSPFGVNVYYDEVSSLKFTDIDIQAMSKEECTHLKLTPITVAVGTFAFSDKGKDLLESIGILSDKDKAKFKQNLVDTFERCRKELIATEMTKEKPYQVKLHGNDDASWATTFSTMNEVEDFILELEKFGYSVVKSKMFFTN